MLQRGQINGVIYIGNGIFDTSISLLDSRIASLSLKIEMKRKYDIRQPQQPVMFTSK